MNESELYVSLRVKDKKKLDHGYTLNELIAASGKSRAWVRERLQLLLTKGMLEIGQKTEMDLHGKMVETMAYKFRTKRG